MAIKEVPIGFKKYRISYEMQNHEADKCILFLHGWGASRVIMKKAFGKELPEFCHIYLDLPGFGDSQIYHPLTSKDYAKIVKKFLILINKEPSIILGHSFGGKIATLLNPKCLVLLSSAGVVQKKPFFVRLKIFIFKILKIFGGAKFYSLFASKDVQGMPPVMYETLKKVVNEDMSDVFEKFKNKAYIFWGKEDKATPISSGKSINSFIKDSEYYPLAGDHFFFLLHAKFIADTIREYKDAL